MASSISSRVHGRLLDGSGTHQSNVELTSGVEVTIQT